MSTLSSFVRANAVAFLALFVALGGTSYAAVKLPRNSVTAQQIAPRAVGASEVRDGSLRAGDFAAGQLPSGATGPTGPAGAAGRSALDVLRPGETVRGRVGGDYDSTAAGRDWRAFVSFPIPAASSPIEVWIDGVTSGEACTGTPLDPSAPAGRVCVYPTESFNPAAGTNTHGGSANVFGFAISWMTSSVSDTYFAGTWAYTQA